MEYIAYTFIVLGLVLELFNRDYTREVKNILSLRQYTTISFFLGVTTYGFADGHGFIMMCFILLTVLSSCMLGLTTSVYLEVEEQYVSKTVQKRGEK